MLWVNQLGELSLPSLCGRWTSSIHAFTGLCWWCH